MPLANIDAPQRVLIDQVLPGDAEVTAGQSIDIQASIQGLYANEAVTCVWNSVTKQDQFELIYDKEVNHYVGTLAVPYTSARVINYEVIAGDASAGPYTLSVQDAPVVAIDRINYSPPKYTRLGNFSKTVGAIKAIDGTNIEITAQVNRPVKRAKIEFNPALVGERLQATAGVVEMSIDSTGKGLSAKFAVRTDSNLPGTRAKESYRILVWDEVNQENIDPIIYPIDVLADIPPEIAITLPAKTPKDVPFNAQQRVELHASDPDFGLSRIELQINYGNQRELVPVLWENRAGKLGRQLVSIPIRPEEFNLKIGDTIELIGIATDNRRDDQPGTSPAILQPNVTRTDPIRLRVTAPSSLPAEDDPEADGLSNPQSNPSKPSTQSEGEQGADESAQVVPDQGMQVNRMAIQRMAILHQTRRHPICQTTLRTPRRALRGTDQTTTLRQELITNRLILRVMPMLPTIIRTKAPVRVIHQNRKLRPAKKTKPPKMNPLMCLPNRTVV